MLEELNRGVAYLTRDFIELLDHHYSTCKIHDAWGYQCRTENQQDVIEISWYVCSGSLALSFVS